MPSNLGLGLRGGLQRGLSAIRAEWGLGRDVPAVEDAERPIRVRGGGGAAGSGLPAARPRQPGVAAGRPRHGHRE